MSTCIQDTERHTRIQPTTKSTLINGAAIQERAISTGVQSCIKDLNAINAQVLEATSAINQYKTSDPINYMVKIAYEGLKLTRNLTMATTSCGSLTTPVSKEESTAVLSAVGSIAPRAETMFSALITKKPEIEADVIAPVIIKGHFANVSNGFAALDPHLVDITPAEEAAVINAYVSRISSAYTSFKNAFGIA